MAVGTLNAAEPNVSENISVEKTAMDTFVVTATREEKIKSEIAESVSVFNGEDIEDISPSHPSELLNRSAGVYVNNLGGEGHMTAIRQPITTRGVYLFLEDGVPVRPTGFFNHNALYEVNIPQSGNMEVVKGPGSALYGSDAIGGMINAISMAPPKETTYRINTELGSYGWKRVLLSAGGTEGDHAANVSVNITDNEGYRNESEYDRQSLSARWDFSGDNLSVKTLLSYTEVNQSGVSSLEEDDYKNDTKKNRFHGDVGYREVEALRFSSEFSLAFDNGLLSFIPFYRNNTTIMSPSWMVTYDPNVRESKFESFGLLTKYRHDFSDTVQLISGLDIDYTPSTYVEEDIIMEPEGFGVDIYTRFSKTGNLHYDFEADQTSLSPYLQLETRLFDRLITTVGVRYDHFKLEYDDQIDSAEVDTRHRRPESQTVTFDQVSPKLGVVYEFNDSHNVYANYRHAFTIPSAGTLFRSGSTQNTVDLEPIKADSYEIGFRGFVTSWFNYEVAAYHLVKEDDLVTVVNGFTRNIYNAGETEHNGIELTLTGDITNEFSYALALSKTDQTYKKFEYYEVSFPGPVVTAHDLSGNDVGKAPETTGNFIIAYAPVAVDGLRFEIEWEHLGEYYTDETNTNTYEGHDLYNFRTSYQASENFEVYGRVQNLTDELYSTYTSNQVGDADISYRPGLPRTYYAGVRLNF